MNYKKVIKLICAISTAGCLAFSLAGCSAVSDITHAVTEVTSESTETSASVNSDNAELFTDRDLDPSYEASKAETITLSDSGSTSSSKLVEIDGSTIKITEGGIYELTGTLTDGQIIIEADDEKVQLVLCGVNITNTSSATIYVLDADKVFITLQEDTENYLATTGEFVQTDDNNVDAVIFSKDDIVLNGEGSLTITTKYGHGVVSKDDLKITSGTYTVNVSKDAFSGNDSLSIADGNFTVSAGDDAFHSDNITTVNGGNINILTCYEGLEGTAVVVNDGNIVINASDDGLNAGGGNDGSGAGNESFNPFSSTDNSSYYIQINGGNITINAEGDGVDANGSIYVTGGYTLINGPTMAANGALDYDGTGEITGGTFIAIGASGMAMNFSSADQGSILVSGVSIKEGDTITLTDSKGNVVLSLESQVSTDSILLSSEDINSSETYTLTIGSSSTEIKMDGNNLYGSGFSMGFGGTQGGFGGGKPEGDFGGGHRS